MEANKKAVFFDRDGTLIEDKHYLKDLEQVVFFDDAIECLRLLKEAGFLIVVVSNQSGVARGMMTEQDVCRVNARFCAMAEEAGVSIDAVYYCPHLETGSVAEYAIDCSCRKPKPGMAEQAAKDLGLDLSSSYMVGDKAADVLFAVNSGMKKAFLVPTGYGLREKEKTKGIDKAEAVASLREAVLKILEVASL